jgi:hypothetical protein
LKEGQYLFPLLDFASAVLFSHNRVFDASKVSITTYTPDTAETPQQDLKWASTHLYYLSLRHTPSLVKSWYLDSSRNRAVVQAVETFTERYLSPLLIAAELTSVSSWLQTREKEEEEMTVKVSKSVREVTATYPVDDQAMEIVFRLPSDFPLRQVEVVGVRRVGLNEKKFRQMMMASQAVIDFQV